jgi:hypothetical protein
MTASSSSPPPILKRVISHSEPYSHSHSHSYSQSQSHSNATDNSSNNTHLHVHITLMNKSCYIWMGLSNTESNLDSDSLSISHKTTESGSATTKVTDIPYPCSDGSDIGLKCFGNNQEPSGCMGSLVMATPSRFVLTLSFFLSYSIICLISSVPIYYL